MVFLHQQMPSRKRPPPSSSAPSCPPSKSSKPAATANSTNPTPNDAVETPAIDKMVSILADAGCTLLNHSGPPCLPSDLHKLRRHLHRTFSSSENASVLLSDFLSGLSSYINTPKNLRRILTASARSESLLRHLLLVPTIQLQIQNMLLEKLPEYFHVYTQYSGPSLSLEDDVARLIINHFRWLDFLVDPNALAEKLMQILSICPLHLKKEIIGSLPEIIGDQNNKTVVEALEKLLQEDSAVVVPVLDSFSNLNLDPMLQEQVTTIALSCIRTIEAEHMPHLLRFLLLSATPSNVRRIISQIRQQLKFVGVSNYRTSQQKLKGKSRADNTEASILDALRSSLRFKNILCQEILKELNSLEKAQDHKVIDIWLLMLIYMNGESLQRSVEKLFKKKIIEDCIQEAMFDQCIHGHKELVQDYFLSFISLSEYLLACKEQKSREFGMYIYVCLFEEFADMYSRQEVLGSLVTHVGSSVGFEVGSALETLALLASKYAQQLIPLSSHISGILDYLEGFSVENLHKVYEIFGHLALLARSSAYSYGSSFANELLMIVRKQVTHPDLNYKKMGLVGTLKIVSCLGDATDVTCPSPSQKSNCDEALELLKTSLDSCRQLPLPLIMFYDELTETLDCKLLHPTVIEWIGKHVGEFESLFLSDLDGGNLAVKDSYCGLEGELWMNLDGDISPICLNILPLASSTLQSSSSLQVLPANFLLLAAIERLTNQGSLGGIDALLGCPLHLPSSKYLFGSEWKSLTGKQKQIICASLYYAANWIRELLNAFCTQVTGRFEFTSQATKEDILSKLMKRLRNLVFLESILNNCIERCSLSLPELHPYADIYRSSLLSQPHHMVNIEKKIEHKKTHEATSPRGMKKNKKISKASTTSYTNAKLRQPTLFDVLEKAGVLTGQEVPNEDSSCLTSKSRSYESSEKNSSDSNEAAVIEISAIAKAIDAQRFKFRPLLVHCYSILGFAKSEASCCVDAAAELPLYLYLLRDVHYKLDYLNPGKQLWGRGLSPPVGFTRMTVDEFLSKVKPLCPSIKRHFDSALLVLTEGDETCEEHWNIQSTSARNPDIPNLVHSKTAVSTSMFKKVLHCFNAILNLPGIQTDKPALSYLLEAFQPTKIPDSFLEGIQLNLSPGTSEYLYFGAYSFFEGVLDIACSLSFMLASESLFTLESIVSSVHKFISKMEGNGKNMHSGFVQEALPTLRTKLGISAEKILKHRFDENLENGGKCKGEMVQKILRIYLENRDSTSDRLEQLACTILPEWTKGEDDEHGFPSLSSGTFAVWNKILHEENLTVLNKLVKEAILLKKARASAQHNIIEKLLSKLQQSVNVVVSLVNLCKTHDKVTLHAMAVGYGGKFIDSFMKVFDFLQSHFEVHREDIIHLVLELQKATRTIQTLCSEAKGLRQTSITRKIPATKRSMERLLFSVKALLHTSSNGCTFWMGSLKHKDLKGQVVSSQVYMDTEDDHAGEETAEAADETADEATDDYQPENPDSEEDRETE
ncbi:LOW QUALITY PROTEIN: Fanconi anemia group D2 protein homolog [Pyrus x bretschneideri]|uniref:LOW QUALITY PROTEIN: Fanconi anemia group D2 protein homolog n=1 Tax=Pyrus x bretschneideri TaxID=225117 RepID=UPI00202FE19A|nr:LOW QUALITY PROTEIN: Fanconi anemia group D2 protein homolog [Pyrus x bretschneideri]